MHIASKHIIATVFFILLLYGCSTKKNTPATRAYHELTTRYNVYFNAEEAYNEAFKLVTENHQDNYYELLPMYPNSSNPKDTTVKEPGGPFDTTIEKTTKAIQEHSISAKPRRDPSQSNTQEYRDWLRQNEFNPFIDQAWLLLGKAHVQNKDYAEAVLVFSQTVRLFNYDIDVVSEAQIWMMRAYTEMGWFSDAETLASTLQTRSLPKDLYNNFIEFYTFLLLRNENYREAIPFLTETIENEKNEIQKRRLRFLLGQLYTNLGEHENAYKAYERIKGVRTPYDIIFNTLMEQSQIGINSATIVDNLQKMAKNKKNEEYLDQIYAAIGNIYLSQNNIEKATENYLLAETKSTRNGIDKALAQVALGDIYFDRKMFIKAEPRYSEALGALPKNNEHYSKVEFRTNALKELVPHLYAIAEQDSLQHLAQLPQAEQLRIINAHIAELQKKDRDKERDTYLTGQQSHIPTFGSQQPSVAEASAALINRGTETIFYFYNPQLVSQGQNEFRQRWGNRSLTDNWRLQGIGISDTIALSPSHPLDPSPRLPVSLSSYSPEFYLQQLPVSSEAKAASDKIIENGLYESGKLAKERLEDFDFATGLFEHHLKDFPKSSQRKNVYYQLYLLNLQTGNHSLTQTYKSRIISEFPDSEYAILMSNPNYEHVMRNFAQTQDSLYQRTYQAYQQGKTDEVHKNYEQALILFPNGDLIPKFRLLHSLSFAQKGDIQKVETSLKELAEKHPESDENKFGQNIMEGLSEGKTLVANASALSEINWQSAKIEATADTIRFSDKKNTTHSYLLLFSRNAVKKSELLFAVSNFNFSNFQIRTFSTSYIHVSPYEAIQVKSFRSFNEADRYAKMIASDSLFRQNIPASIIPLVISDKNLELLNAGKSTLEYVDFYNTELNKIQSDSILLITPLKGTIINKSEKIVPLEPEKMEEPTVVPQQLPKQETEGLTIEQRQQELEQKAEEVLKQNENIPSKKEREQLIKQREKERKEAVRQREHELKQRERARKEEIKQRERERQQKLKEQEKLRKEKLKERERILRERR